MLCQTNSMSIHNPKIVNSITLLMCSLWLCCFIFARPSYAKSDFGSDTIIPGQELNDWKYLESATKKFVLCFFNLGTSKERYLGIFSWSSWVNFGRSGEAEKPVWVANPNEPITDSSGILLISGTTGMLFIRYNGGNIILPTSLVTNFQNNNTIATLQDDGNLVMRQVYPNGSTSGTVLWQSFDYPTDTLLPGMKLGIDLKTRQEWSLTSWKSAQVPSSGSFTLGMDRNTTIGQLVILWHGSVFWTSGHLHNGSFKNFQDIMTGINFNYFSNENGEYFTYSPPQNGGNSSDFGEYINAIVLTPDGSVKWISSEKALVHCDLYSTIPQLGCVNYSWPECVNGDYRFSYYGVSYDYSLGSIPDRDVTISIIDCKAKCMRYCPCYGYTSANEDDTGCELFYRETVEGFPTRGFPTGKRPLYLRSTPTRDDLKVTKSKRWWIWLIIAVIIGPLMLFRIFCIKNYKVKEHTSAKRKEAQNLMLHELVETTSDPSGRHTAAHGKGKHEIKRMTQVHQFKFETIEMATDKFSLENKLGEGGFGPVYKGTLLNGQDIAVKKLSRNSSQGMVEFKNEVQLIVKLQHKNLVRLLGCCIHREDMMLVYEYMPNKSLDFFLFDSSKRSLLEWRNLMNIIEGITQGLLYLHQHSRLTVIHCDLKASNILLDQNMTPKISDFGMAKIFGLQDGEVNTKRIVGTHGYMSPEYAIKGVVSTKTDVFSFGFLVLEIVSGKKNHRSYNSERPLNLIGLAWELWIEARALDLIDTIMDVSNRQHEIERCINIGLLCVQDHATDRPSMADVILMLKNELLPLPTPKQPAFFIETSTADKEIEEGQEKICSNKLSTSIMEAR